MARKKNKRSVKKYQAGGGYKMSETMPDSHLWEGAQSERSPILDDYGNIPSLNVEGDPRESGAPYFPRSTPPPNVPWNPWNPEGNSVRPEPGRGGMILPETKEKFDQRMNDMFSDNTVSPILRSISKMNSLNWEGIKRNGGEVLSSFKSAARFDQPKFKNGRRTKG